MSNKKYKILNVANTETGEISTLITEINDYQQSKKTFTKVFNDKNDNNYEVIKTLSYAEQTIYLYIIYNLKMYSKKITLHFSLFEFGKQKYYKAISGLIDKNIITKSIDKLTGSIQQNIYLVNTNLIFNGKI